MGGRDEALGSVEAGGTSPLTFFLLIDPAHRDGCDQSAEIAECHVLHWSGAARAIAGGGAFADYSDRVRIGLSDRSWPNRSRLNRSGGILKYEFWSVIVSPHALLPTLAVLIRPAY